MDCVKHDNNGGGGKGVHLVSVAFSLAAFACRGAESAVTTERWEALDPGDPALVKTLMSNCTRERIGLVVDTTAPDRITSEPFMNAFMQRILKETRLGP